MLTSYAFLTVLFTIYLGFDVKNWYFISIIGDSSLWIDVWRVLLYNLFSFVV